MAGYTCLGSSDFQGFSPAWVPGAFPYPARTPSERFHCGQVRSVDVFLVLVTLLVAFLKVTKTFCVLWFYASYPDLDSISLTFCKRCGHVLAEGDAPCSCATCRKDTLAPLNCPCCSALSANDRLCGEPREANVNARLVLVCRCFMRQSTYLSKLYVLFIKA